MRHISEILLGVMAGIDRERQADAFCQMYRRDPSGDWRETFDRWADSKELMPADRQAIEREVESALLADGTLVYTDPAAA